MKYHWEFIHFYARLSGPQCVSTFFSFVLQWHHNGHYCASNHQLHHCLLKRLFRPRSKNGHLRMADPGRYCSHNKTRASCGVMSGEVKLGEADYTVIWETLLFMSNILCQISWKETFDAYNPFKAFCCWKMRKTFATNVFFCEYVKTRDLC